MLEVTLAQPDELPFILNTYIRSQEQHYPGPRPAIRSWLRTGLLGQLERPDVVVLVIRDEGVALGCLVAEPRRGLEGVPESWTVTHLYTKAAWRRTGVATLLLSSLPGTVDAYSCRTFPVGRRWAERLGATYVGDNVAHHSGPSGLHRQRGERG